MKRLSVIIVFAVVSGVFLLSKCTENKGSDAENKKDTSLVGFKSNSGYESQTKWGEHLVRSMGCGDCHTPKKMGPMGPQDDSSLLLSGHPANVPAPQVDRNAMESRGLAVTNDLTVWVGPWGISYAANITSDTTGIGMWSEDQFLYAIRNGKQKGLPGSRILLPPMPWQSIMNLTDDELKAIFSYLKSTKPVINMVPPPSAPVVQRKM